MVSNDILKLNPSNLTFDEVKAKVAGFNGVLSILTKREKELLALANSLLTYINIYCDKIDHS